MWIYPFQIYTSSNNGGKIIVKKFKKIALIVISVIIVFSLGRIWGWAGKTAEVNNELYDIGQVREALKEYKKEKREAKEDLEAFKEKNKEVYALADKKDELQAEVDGLKDKVKDVKSDYSKSKSELDDLKTEIDAKQAEFDRLTMKVVDAQSAPKTLQAGSYTVGSDIDAGRYKATPVGEGSNFVTYTDTGDVDVNTILGVDGEPSYTFEVGNGYTIRTESTVKLTPID